MTLTPEQVAAHGPDTRPDPTGAAYLPEPDLGTPRVRSEETVTLTIDGREVSVPAGTSVLESSHFSSLEVTLMVRSLPPSPEELLVQAARVGTRSARAVPAARACSFIEVSLRWVASGQWVVAGAGAGLSRRLGVRVRRKYSGMTITT